MDKILTAFQRRKANAERIGVAGVLLVVAGGLVYAFAETVPLSAALAVGGAILVFFSYANFTQIEEEFKSGVLSELIERSVQDADYDHKRGLTPHQVYQCEFLKTADRFHSEDFLSGTIDNVAFVSSDVVLKERRVQTTKHGTQTYYHTYFKGRMFTFEFNKHFEGVLQVLEETSPVTRRPFERVKLESVDFNKKFKTFATDSHLAFYVLTPHFMDALLRFEANHPGKLSFSFIDSKLHIGINNFKDTFSLKFFQKMNQEMIQTFQQDIDILYTIVDELKLNRNIFKTKS